MSAILIYIFVLYVLHVYFVFLFICVVLIGRVLAQGHYGNAKCVREVLDTGVASSSCVPASFVLSYLDNLYDISAHIRSEVRINRAVIDFSLQVRYIYSLCARIISLFYFADVEFFKVTVIS